MKKLLTTTALATALLATVPSAYASIITIGLGLNGGAITNEGSAVGNFIFSGIFGDYEINNVSGTGAPFLTLPSLLNSNSLNAASLGSSDVLNVYVTESGITSPTGLVSFLSSFTENSLTAGWSVTEETFLSTANALFTGTLLDSITFLSGPLTNQLTATSNAGLGPYSVTAEYTISSNNISGSANSTINLDATAVPEPASLTILGAALVGLGLIRRRRRQAA